MMEALLASSMLLNENGTFPSRNCAVQRTRRLFTPLGSYGVHAFSVHILPIICILGIIGNIITFIIINESSNRIIGHFYIKMLTIFDSLSLIFVLPTIWIVLMVRPYHHFQDPYGNTWADVVSTRWGWCQVRLITTFFTRTLSIYTIVLFTLERCLKIMTPLRAQSWCTIGNAKKSIVVLIVVSFLLSIQYGFGFKKFMIKSPCHEPVGVCKTNDNFFRSRTFSMIFLSVIPSIVIIVCNFLIIYGMRKSAGSRFRQPVAYKDDEPAGQSAPVVSEETKQQREITFRLLLVSFTFFILNFPLFVVTSVHSQSQLTNQKFHLRGAWADAFQFVLILFVLNLAINFVLYCFTGSLFRKAAFNLLLCRMSRMRRFRAGLSGTPQSASTIVTRDPSALSRGDSSRQLLKKQKEKKKKEEVQASETGV